MASSEQESRRAHRWSYLLDLAQWPRDMESPFSPSSLTFKRQQRQSQESEAFPSSSIAPHLDEQGIRTHALLYLLAYTSTAARTTDACQSGALQRLKDILSHFLGQSFELPLGAAACLVQDLMVDLRVFTFLPANQRCCQLTRHFCEIAEDESYLPLHKLCLEAIHGKASHQFWLYLATQIDQQIQQRWSTMTKDPLAAKVKLLIRKRRAARYDQTLLDTLVDAVAAGPQALVLAQRSTMICRAKRAPTATSIEEHKLCQYVQGHRTTLPQQPWPLQLGLAIDASRRGGYKVLLGCCLDGGSLEAWWPVPQNMRDFRSSLEHSRLVDEDFASALVLGMHMCNAILSGQDSSTNPEEPERQKKKPRIAAYDLGIALENMLAQMGTSLTAFLS